MHAIEAVTIKISEACELTFNKKNTSTGSNVTNGAYGCTVEDVELWIHDNTRATEFTPIFLAFDQQKENDNSDYNTRLALDVAGDNVHLAQNPGSCAISAAPCMHSINGINVGTSSMPAQSAQILDRMFMSNEVRNTIGDIKNLTGLRTSSRTPTQAPPPRRRSTVACTGCTYSTAQTSHSSPSCPNYSPRPPLPRTVNGISSFQFVNFPVWFISYFSLVVHGGVNHFSEYTF